MFWTCNLSWNTKGELKMAEAWVSTLITVAIGVAGGIVSSIITTIIGRAVLRRKLKKEIKNIKSFAKGKICISCEREILNESAFCPFCNKPVAGSKACRTCQIALPDDAIYCYRCQSSALSKEVFDKEPEVITKPDIDPELVEEVTEEIAEPAEAETTEEKLIDPLTVIEGIETEFEDLLEQLEIDTPPETDEPRVDIKIETDSEDLDIPAIPKLDKLDEKETNEEEEELKIPDIPMDVEKEED
jgi:RNA polymerase subunit RPABC4/transcription elongation factor Spt4